MEHKAPVLGLMDTEGLKATRKMLTVRKHDQQGKGEDHQDRDSTPKAYNDTHSGQDLGDEDNGARGTYFSDSDQETVCGHGSGEDKDSFGRNHKAADNANDPGHSYEDEEGDHQYEYVDHRNSNKNLEDSDADSQATNLVPHRLSRSWTEAHRPLACPTWSSLSPPLSTLSIVFIDRFD
ncbi:hypothetical protein BGZ89_000909 [Linnemannia elongata]|nr:hypothetical protein BGZ89_000909 [Linnemannia elongata]